MINLYYDEPITKLIRLISILSTSKHIYTLFIQIIDRSMEDNKTPIEQVRELYIHSQFYKEWGINTSISKVEIHPFHSNYMLIEQKLKDEVEYRTVGVYVYFFGQIYETNSIRQLIHHRLNNINSYLRELSATQKQEQQDEQTDLDQIQVFEQYL